MSLPSVMSTMLELTILLFVRNTILKRQITYTDGALMHLATNEFN